MGSARTLFTEDQQQAITGAVEHAEKKTSGELRVYIEEECTGDTLDRASFIFEQLEMHTTRERNGVLFYLATAHRRFAIIGDAGINAVVGDDFWTEIKNLIIEHFKEGKFTEGLSKGIDMAGDALQKHFPRRSDDTNELSNDIVFGGDNA